MSQNAPGPVDPTVASAGFFARQAKHLGDDLHARRLDLTDDEREIMASEIIAFAVTSLALSAVKPPARYRPARLETREVRA